MPKIQTVGTPLGTHVIMDLYECDAELLDNMEEIERILTDAAKVARSKIIGKKFYKFHPHGVSGVVLVAESHIAIHTWPEYGYASVDIYTCGRKTKPMNACEYIVKALKSERHRILKMERGIINNARNERKE